MATTRETLIKNEVDLARVVVNHFHQWETFKEVPCNGNITDIVCHLHDIQIAIETKMSFTFKVLEQAIHNKQFYPFSYICVPYTERNSSRGFQRKMCKDYGVGLLEVTKNGECKENVIPQENHNFTPVKLREFMKFSIAGSKTGQMTEFKWSIEQIRNLLDENKGGLDLNQVISRIDHHWSRDSLARASIIKYCRTNIIKDLYVDNGIIFKL